MLLSAIRDKVTNMVRGRLTADALEDAKAALRIALQALPEHYTAQDAQAETVNLANADSNYDLTGEWIQVTEAIITTSAGAFVSALSVRTIEQLLLDASSGSIRTNTGTLADIRGCSLIGNSSGTQSMVLDRKPTDVSGHKLVIYGSKMPTVDANTVIPNQAQVEQAVKLIAMGLAGQEIGNPLASQWMESGLLLLDFGRGLLDSRGGLPTSGKRKEANYRS